MTLLILLLILGVLLWPRRTPGPSVSAKPRTGARLATTTEIRRPPEPPDYAGYHSPAWRRKRDPQAKRLAKDLAEFRKDADADLVDHDWITRLIRDEERD